MAFELPKLPYAFAALEPHIYERTMENHYTKHQQADTTNLNAAIQGTALGGKSIDHILQNLHLDNKAARDNGGRFYNHNLFSEIFGPDGGGTPTGELVTAINEAFES